MSKDKVVERELQRLRSENSTLRKTVGRLRKRLLKLDPTDIDEEAIEVVEPKKSEGCPICHAPLSSLTTPNKSVIFFCSKKCGYRKKA